MQRSPNLLDRLEALIGPSLEAMGFELVRIRFSGGKRPRLQVMAERPDGTMSVEDCAEASRALSAILDVEDPIEGEYVLEVSSPGIDRPLTRPIDFECYAGFETQVELAAPHQGRRRFRGRLLGRSGDVIRLDVAGLGEMALPLAALADAKLVLTDDLIRASLRQSEQSRDRQE